MKAEFTIDVDSNGDPVIDFRHHDKNGSLEQKMLGIFIKKAFENGLSLRRVSGYADPQGNSHDRYSITTKTSNE